MIKRIKTQVPLFALFITKNGNEQLTEPNITNGLQSNLAQMQLSIIMAQHLSEVVIVIDESVIVTYWIT